MATFRLEIKTDGAAFGDSPELELSRILEGLSEEVLSASEEILIKDVNGNTIGKATLR